jgi:hypothetical protein
LRFAAFRDGVARSDVSTRRSRSLQGARDPAPLTSEKRDGIMTTVAATPHVTLSGDIEGEYVVTDQRPSGELTLAPDTSAQTILSRLGHERATLAEFEAEYGPVLPPDGEG